MVSTLEFVFKGFHFGLETLQVKALGLVLGLRSPVLTTKLPTVLQCHKDFVNIGEFGIISSLAGLLCSLQPTRWMDIIDSDIGLD